MARGDLTDASSSGKDDRPDGRGAKRDPRCLAAPAGDRNTVDTVLRGADEIAGNQDLAQRTSDQASSWSKLLLLLMRWRPGPSKCGEQGLSGIVKTHHEVVQEGQEVVKETAAAMEAITESSAKQGNHRCQ